MQHWQERNKSSDGTQLSCNLLMLEPEIAKGVFDLKRLSTDLSLLSLWGKGQQALKCRHNSHSGMPRYEWITER